MNSGLWRRFCANRSAPLKRQWRSNINPTAALDFQLCAGHPHSPTAPVSSLRYLGIFIQDSWTINRRLTLNLGLRYAHDNGFLPNQCRIAAPPPFDTLYPAQCFSEIDFKIWNSVAPRLHAAFDLTGDGRTVIRGGWGRFFNIRGQEELDVANNNVDLTTTFRWRDLDGDKRFESGEADLNPNGPDFVSRQSTLTGGLNGLVNNPDLKAQGSDEYSLSIERQIMPDFGLRLTGVYSKNFNTLRVLNLSRPPSSYNIPITNLDPGPDGKLGTADDTGRFITYFDYPASLAGATFQRPTFVNDPGSDANYKSVEIAATKRLSNRWHMQGYFSATKIYEPTVPDIVGTSQRSLSATSLNPNAELFGVIDLCEWQFGINGSYLLSHDIQFSTNFLSQSGDPWARTVSFTGGSQIPSITLRVEPIGTRRTPTVNNMSIGAEKSFRIVAEHRLGVRAQVYNVLNGNAIGAKEGSRLQINTLSGASFAKPLKIMNPRIAEVSLFYRF